MMKMFWVNLNRPTAKIAEVEVTVKVCKKHVWATLPDGHRRLIGSSMFQTLPAAQRCQRALLEKIVAHPWAPFNRPHLRAAQTLLKTLH